MWRGRPLPSTPLVALVLLAASLTPLAAQGGPLVPPSSGGIARFDRLLQQLAEPRRLLVVAAHPDDEDTAVLTLAARGYGADAAYLALSRGEGGQNLIGPELGVALGLLRTRELEAARAVDGARQFFTRAFDFGYTRSLDETQRFWLPDTILKDVVRIVRRFRPHVVVAVFAGNAGDGHGQHQMAGVMAHAAFDAAGDPARYPELEREEGLHPWTPLKLYEGRRFLPDAATLRYSAARMDPREGRTISQIAMDSRSRHRSQDFGSLQRLEPTEIRLALQRGPVDPVADTALFDGIPRASSWLTALADSLRRTTGPAALERTVPALAEALTRLRAEGGTGSPEEQLLAEALAIAAGVVVDARSERARIVQGERVALELEALNTGSDAVTWQRARVVPAVPGWEAPVSVQPDRPTVASGALGVARAVLTVPDDAATTRPYFLAHPLAAGLYDWGDAPPPVRGLPDAPAPLAAEFVLEIGGVPVTIRREVTYREQDQAWGERRFPLRIVPRLEVTVEPDTLVWSVHGPDVRELVVSLRHHAADTTAGEVRVAVDGWSSPSPRPFVLAGREATTTVTVAIRRPADARSGDVTARVTAIAAERSYADGATVLAYPHIRPTLWPRRAETRIRLADLRLPSARRIGYVRGASDRVPEALWRAGLPVELLDPVVLARGDLTPYDVIVIGSRAYETDTALVAHNDRLLAWVRAGGHLLVQYQQYQFAEGGFAPYPLAINQPHDRITDETSPVTVLDPSHVALRHPNAIGPDDWAGWPQERGLYFAGTWDAAYVPLLEMQDPDRPPVRGGLLVARVGRGTYVYTGLSFFRALPAGSPGAFRLFSNLLDLGRTMAGGAE